ncbi:MAG: integral rane protein putatine [Spirosoma sp.]|nr:integral rane protein putatine [Spirosoma sp.]
MMTTASLLLGNVVPNPTPVVPPQAGGLLTILNWATGIGLLIGVLGVIIVGISMAIQLRRGEGGEAVARLGWVLMGCIVISGASGIVRAFV